MDDARKDAEFDAGFDADFEEPGDEVFRATYRPAIFSAGKAEIGRI